jgi:hypothetical protein
LNAFSRREWFSPAASAFPANLSFGQLDKPGAAISDSPLLLGMAGQCPTLPLAFSSGFPAKLVVQ